jgi:hypothetical protein
MQWRDFTGVNTTPIPNRHRAKPPVINRNYVRRWYRNYRQYDCWNRKEKTGLVNRFKLQIDNFAMACGELKLIIST